jgi:hypothetical protein
MAKLALASLIGVKLIGSSRRFGGHVAGIEAIQAMAQRLAQRQLPQILRDTETNFRRIRHGDSLCARPKGEQLWQAAYEAIPRSMGELFYQALLLEIRRQLVVQTGDREAFRPGHINTRLQLMMRLADGLERLTMWQDLGLRNKYPDCTRDLSGITD